MSTNISKIKREQLAEKIGALRDYIARCPQDDNTANLLQYISEIEKDIKGKKYGLVFEEHRESIDEVLENNLPVLTEDESLLIDNGGQMNFLIEGDNLASLKLLEKTHAGKIDLIYIDPPYNTGNKDFVYDDAFIDSNDTFRHSKWLSFMEKRLNIAKKLMAENGFIFISIDDNEQAQIKMLCDDIFGENNIIGCIARLAKAGGNKGDFLKPKKDYVLVYAKKLVSLNKDSFGRIIDKQQTEWLNENFNGEERAFCLGEIPYRAKLDSRPNQRYYIECPDGSLIIPPGTVFPSEKKDSAMVKPSSNNDKCWTWSQERYITEKSIGRFYFYKTKKPIYLDENGNPSIWGIRKKIFKSEYDEIDKKEILVDFLADFQNAQGTAEVKKLKLDFSFPKPTALISYFVDICGNSKSTILDFFAGSGTTGHAVMKLNAEDGGQRKFILCTNNENNICRDVTYERIKRVIDKENYEASLKYFKVDYVPISEQVYYEYADELLSHVKELVELENGINFKGNANIAIVLTDEELSEFVQSEAVKSCKTLYLGHDVAPDNAAQDALSQHGIQVNIIPEYYYSEMEI